MMEVQASKQPERGGPQGGEVTTKNGTLHQWHEAYQLKRWEIQIVIEQHVHVT
jgi:hypothetical protein